MGYSGTGVEVAIRKPTLDYPAYSRKSRLGRCRQDIGYDLLHETTLSAKLVIYLLGVLSGIAVTVASGILLRVLGWITIGS